MKAILYIEVVDEMVYAYHKPVLAFVQQHFPDTVVFDFDSRSETITAGYAIEIVQRAQKVAIIMQLREGNTGPVLPFLEKVIKDKEKCLVFVNGSNRIVERILSVFDEQQIRKELSENMQQEEISHYLSVTHK